MADAPLKGQSSALTRAVGDGDDDGPLPRSLIPKLRSTYEDSARTKLLKEVLRGSVELHHYAIQDLPKLPITQQTGEKIVRGSSKGFAASLPDLASTGLQELRSAAAAISDMRCSERIDEQCVELVGAQSLHPVLRDSGRRVNQLCDRIRAAQPQAPEGGTRRVKLDFAAKEIDTERARPPEEGAGQVKSRIEQAAANYIREILEFKELEELDGRMVGAKDFHGLREMFPSQHSHHPNVALLADHTLQDKDDFRRCIWAKQRPAPLKELQTPKGPSQAASTASLPPSSQCPVRGNPRQRQNQNARNTHKPSAATTGSKKSLRLAPNAFKSLPNLHS